MAQLVKNPPAMRETWVRSLGWEDALEKGKAAHSSIQAWRIPWTVYHGVTKSRTRLSDFHFHLENRTKLHTVSLYIIVKILSRSFNIKRSEINGMNVQRSRRI